MAQFPVKNVTPHPRARREECWSDCWPDWGTQDEDIERMKAMARDNSPRLVFTEIGRILTAILFVTVLVGALLGAFSGK